MTLRAQLLIEIETFLRQTGMAPTRFGLIVMSDKSFVWRLRAGTECESPTVDRVRSYIQQNKPATRKKGLRRPLERGAAA